MSADARKAMALRRRLDALALEQLRVEAARLYVENEALREEAARANEAANWWREQAIDLQLAQCEETGGAPGITTEGQLVVVGQTGDAA